MTTTSRTVRSQHALAEAVISAMADGHTNRPARPAGANSGEWDQREDIALRCIPLLDARVLFAMAQEVLDGEEDGICSECSETCDDDGHQFPLCPACAERCTCCNRPHIYCGDA